MKPVLTALFFFSFIGAAMVLLTSQLPDGSSARGVMDIFTLCFVLLVSAIMWAKWNGGK